MQDSRQHRHAERYSIGDEVHQVMEWPDKFKNIKKQENGRGLCFTRSPETKEGFSAQSAMKRGLVRQPGIDRAIR